MNLKKLLTYLIIDLSCLGSLSLYCLVIVYLLLIQNYGGAFFLFILLLMMYLIGIPSKLLLFRTRRQPKNQDTILLKTGSFFSFHTARATILSLYFASVSGTGITAYFILLIIALLVGVGRVVNQKHYLVDIIGGFVVGIILFYLLTPLA